MPANFLIIGTATDGPSNVAYRPKNLRDLKSVFGGENRERFYLSPTATSLTLQFEPLRTPINEVNTKKQYLFFPTMDATGSTIMYFGNIGGTGTHTVDLIYNPYLGKSDVVAAAERFFDEVGYFPYIIRLGGVAATASGDGWEFEAKYAGTKYNYLGIASNGSSMTVFGMEPAYITKTYNFTTTQELKEAIERDYQIGICPFVCTAQGTAMLASGTYWFSGGTDGSFSDADVDYLMTNFNFPLSISHVLFLSPITSSIVETVANSLLTYDQPRMFFIPSIEYTTTGTVVDYITEMDSTIPYRHNMISAFVGDIEANYNGILKTRYAAEGATIAYAKSGSYNLTNLSVTAESFYPVLSASGLGLLKANGLIPLMRYIKNDIAVYEGTTTYAENTFLYSSKVAEISSIAHDFCFQYFGYIVPNGERREIASELKSRLSNVQYISIQDVRVYKQGEEMFVNIEGLLPDEILTISFTVQNK